MANFHMMWYHESTNQAVEVGIMTVSEQKTAAKEFAERWKGRGSEKSDSQTFWTSLLRDVYGVEHPEDLIEFEDEVHLDNTSFIDG